MGALIGALTQPDQPADEDGCTAALLLARGGRAGSAPAPAPATVAPADLLRGLGDGTADPQLAEMLKQFGVEDVDPQVMAMAFQQFQSMLADGDDGPVDAARAHDTARAVAAVGGDPVPSEPRRRQAVEAVHVQLRIDDLADRARADGVVEQHEALAHVGFDGVAVDRVGARGEL